ncbi:hypothetical protein [Pseudolactococcus reticulitermitis]|uniref:Phosphate starvation-inducible protein PhoH n=1 Tax=Pseudolactococcus reticulitermitis TaxID=2025039 RepID=A0A224X9U4_9LACT|nr:hypothetical protein [Lactococcus reticulitermitis]GAX46471.1 hypothetical protein RsY01_50 [Lactococcus reticulitermitis]
MKQNHILQLDAKNAFTYQLPINPMIDLVDQYLFEAKLLNDYDCLLITEFVDQELLYRHRQAILHFLNSQKIVIFCGQLFRDFIPGATLFMPKAIKAHQDYNLYITPESEIFKSVKVDELNYRRGVAGFNARGYHRPAETAEIQLTFKSGEVVTYIDRTTTPGTILMHAGRNLFGYQGENKSTDQISQNTLAWVNQEILKLKGGLK